MNDFVLALQTGAILLRKGLEAILIVTALAAALRRGGLLHRAERSVHRLLPGGPRQHRQRLRVPDLF